MLTDTGSWKWQPSSFLFNHHPFCSTIILLSIHHPSVQPSSFIYPTMIHQFNHITSAQPSSSLCPTTIHLPNQYHPSAQPSKSICCLPFDAPPPWSSFWGPGKMQSKKKGARSHQPCIIGWMICSTSKPYLSRGLSWGRTAGKLLNLLSVQVFELTFYFWRRWLKKIPGTKLQNTKYVQFAKSRLVLKASNIFSSIS